MRPCAFVLVANSNSRKSHGSDCRVLLDRVIVAVLLMSVGSQKDDADQMED